MKGRELYAGPDEQQGLSHFRKFLDEYILALILIPLLLLQAAVQCSAEKPLAKHFVVEPDILLWSLININCPNEQFCAGLWPKGYKEQALLLPDLG